MTLKIFIKEPQKVFLDGIVERYFLSNCQEAIKALVKFASIDNQKTNDEFFDKRCVGSCYDPDIPVSLYISADEVEYLKRMLKQYDLEDYDTVEEKLGKAVRCLINYADQDGDQKSIFTIKKFGQDGSDFKTTNKRLIYNFINHNLIQKTIFIMIDRTLNEVDKNKIIQIINAAGYNKDNFIWKSRRSFFVFHSMLTYKPCNYYFIFEKNKFGISAKEYFPNWAKKNINDEVGEKLISEQIFHWLKSINRIFSRNNQIVVPLSEGADKRKNFNKIKSSLKKI